MFGLLPSTISGKVGESRSLELPLFPFSGLDVNILLAFRQRYLKSQINFVFSN